MMHDFGITKNYSVILDFPLVFDFKQLSKGKNPVDYRPDLPARIGLAPKESGETIWFSVETCYCFHLLNCWESKNSKNEIEVTVIGCRLPDFNLTTYHQSSPTRPYLWKLNVTTGIVVEKVLFDGLNYGTDFPRCSPKLQGLETRFGFFTLFTPNAPTPDAIGVLKLDLVTLKYSTILFGDSKHGGEVYFQPKKDAKTEDDGYLMTFVHDDLNPNVGELWIMDSKSMAKEPICKVLIPRRVPYGFHCRWVTKEELESQSIYYDN